MGCGVHEGQPQREHQRCPTKPSRVSSVLVCLWPIMTTPGRFRKIRMVSHPHLLKISFYHVHWTGIFTNALEPLSRSRARWMPSPWTPAKRFPNQSPVSEYLRNDDDKKVIILRLLLSSTQLSPAVTSSTVSLYRCRSRSLKRVIWSYSTKKPTKGSYVPIKNLKRVT